MKAYFLTINTLEKFREDIHSNLEDYKTGNLEFVRASDLIPVSKIRIDDIKLDLSENKSSDTDFENIKRFYLAFKDLNDSQATEERLWAGLCHYQPFWSYLTYRWRCETEKNVLDRYFFGEAGRSKFYNGLARLWWYGRMTYDEKSENPFELTEYMCESMNFRGLLPLTLKWSNNKKIYRAYLRTLMNFEKNHKLTQEEHEKARRILNAWGGTILLDSLSDKEISEKIKNYLTKITSQK
ncbi:MAG: hypothetical protein KKF65_00790 [Nanoarchaeota archaeon]|nr:hypothetical protein [Nanoarchaeota archaeon]